VTGPRSNALLEVAGLSASYGAGVVLDDISFDAAEGDAVAVLGRNGVGKSTLMLALTGHLPVLSGTITLAGRDITGLEPQLRAHQRIAWVPQEREIFPSLTVEENIRIALRPDGWSPERVYELFPRLKERRGNFGNQLSGGEQQMLAIGRALALNPQMLLLDEPLEGLAPIVAAEVAGCIKDLIAGAQISVILVEQHAAFALRMSKRALVMERGRIIHAGSAQELLSNPLLLENLIGVGNRRTSAKTAVDGRSGRSGLAGCRPQQ
jgi:branched-chain amino acid transport system ATP-binding protein